LKRLYETVDPVKCIFEEFILRVIYRSDGQARKSLKARSAFMK
jgi:hypothetical protein